MKEKRGERGHGNWGQIMGVLSAQQSLWGRWGAMEGFEQGRAGPELDFNETSMAVVLARGGECGLYCHPDLGSNPLSATALS